MCLITRFYFLKKSPQIANFKAIDLSIIYTNNDQVGYSQIWQQFIGLTTNTTHKNGNNSAPVSKVKLTSSSIMTTLFLICVQKLL